MPISISITADTAGEAVKELLTLAGVIKSIGAQSGAPVKPEEPVRLGVPVPSEPGSAVHPAAPAPVEKKTRAKKEKDAAPAPAAVPAEVQAQDAADEEAESAAAKAETKTLTHEDVRGALGNYVTKYGMPAAQTDGQQVLKNLFGDICKNADGVYAVSKIPADQDSLRKAVDGLELMLNSNPFGREVIKAA